MRVEPRVFPRLLCISIRGGFSFFGGEDMIKRVICLLLCILPVLSLAACTADGPEVTCEQVVEAYQAAGYEVTHIHPYTAGNSVCYVHTRNEAGGDIFIEFFETEEEAEEYADQRQCNVLIWLFSAIYGDPTWMHTETYKNIEIEYTDKKLYEPFEALIK